MEQIWTKTATNSSGFIKSVFREAAGPGGGVTFCSAVLSTWSHHTAQNGYSSTRHPPRLRGRKRRGREARCARHRDGRRQHLAAGSPGSPAALLRTKVGRCPGALSSLLRPEGLGAALVLGNRTPQGLLGLSNWNSGSTFPPSCWTLRHGPVSGCSAFTSSWCWAASRRGLMGHLTCLPSRSVFQCLYAQSLSYSHRNTASRS